MLVEKLANRCINHNNDSVEIIEEENNETEETDDDPSEKEVARFFAESLKNKTNMSSPQFSAEFPKTPKTRQPRLCCQKCEFKATNKTEINKHTKDKH